MDRVQALDWISSRRHFKIRPGLTRIEELLKRLGNPEKTLSMLHFAGTNGKGSTLAFTAKILRQTGLRVATFTSPYIETFGEQIAINGQALSDEKLIKYVECLQPLVDELDQEERYAGITEFEIITALAFQYFADEKVDVALIEVGLGGLLDSTNVIHPLITVITTIGLDHKEFLGTSLAEIAAQKAGIIKYETPLVTGNIVEEALTVIEETAQKNRAKHYKFGEDYRIERLSKERFTYRDEHCQLDNLEKSLLGLHQIENAALAVKVSLLYADEANITLDMLDIRQALRTTFWPVRMEVIAQSPLTILDGAHNTQAISRLLENLRAEFPDKKITIIFSALVTKEIDEMVKMLRTLKGADLVLTSFDYPQAMNVEEVSYLKKEGVTFAADWREKYKELKDSLGADALVVMTGSLYFMSQIRKELLRADAGVEDKER
ncbi:folylpolyglutamate synthase/dihydrofolate synthase family protein [Lactococcus muris]|uniref:tetrahydrofolate synthase n=1 Tax=Lactococcus muris TaxID=2941330 RepID=A0ABV4D7W7_9LACT